MASNMDVASAKLAAPIYSAIESGNYKGALALCTKQLSKHPDSLLTKALKGLTLEQMGKVDEGLAVCKEVADKRPTDVAVLQALGFAYNSQHKYDLLLQAYENAFEQDPSQESLGHHVHMAAVRNNAYLKQQQTANKLFKTHSKDKFMFWSITSLLLQVQEAAKKNPGQPPSLQLTLADKMISKAVLENRVTKYEEMQLYLQILLEKGDVAGVISALDSDLGKTIFKVEADRRRLVLKYLVQLGRWPEVLAASKDILVTFQADDWNVLTTLLDAWFQVHASPSASEIEEFKAFIASFTSSASNGTDGAPPSRDARGPRLVQLEFVKRLHRDDKTALRGQLVPLVEQYIVTFGSKFMCFADLKDFLACLEVTDAQTIISGLKVADGPLTVDAIRRKVFLEQLRRFFRPATTPNSERLDVAKGLLDLYYAALPLGKDLASSERQHGDDFLLLAMHEYLDVYFETGDLDLVFSALVILEGAISLSTANFQLRLLAIQLYIFIGAGSPALNHYNKLKIKHIQQDTVSHFVTHYLGDLALFEQAAEINEDVLGFFDYSNREVADMTVLAYDQQTYSKIREFIDFRERVGASVNRVISTLEMHRLAYIAPVAVAPADVLKEAAKTAELLKPAVAGAEADKFWASRSDNTDHGVLVSWNADTTESVHRKLLKRMGVPKSLAWCKHQTNILSILAKIDSADSAGLSALLDAFVPENPRETALVQLARAIAAYLNDKYAADATEAVEAVLKAIQDHFGATKLTQLQRYIKAKSKEERFCAPGFIADLVAQFEFIGTLLPVVGAFVQLLPAHKTKKDKPITPQTAEAYKLASAVVDALQTATADVRTLAQAGLRDLAEEFERKVDDMAAGFARKHLPEAALVSRPLTIQDILKSVHHSLNAISKEAGLKLNLAKSIKATIPV